MAPGWEVGGSRRKTSPPPPACSLGPVGRALPWAACPLRAFRWFAVLLVRVGRLGHGSGVPQLGCHMLSLKEFCLSDLRSEFHTAGVLGCLRRPRPQEWA